MSVIFHSDSYSVLLEDDRMVFRPSNPRASVLILTPPGIKPQFFSILAVLLAKSGIETAIPRHPLPCSTAGLRGIVARLIGGHRSDLVVMMGFRIDNLGLPSVVIDFSKDLMRHITLSSAVPGSVYELPINDCGWVGGVPGADLVILGEEITLNLIINIKEFILRKVSTRGTCE